MAVSRSGPERVRSLRPSIDELKLYLEDREEGLLAELAYLRLLQQAVPDRVPRNFPAPCVGSTDCAGCGSAGLVRCSRCKVWYCSQKCQMSDWQVHKLNCVPLPPLENPDGTPFHQGHLPLRQPMLRSAAQTNIASENTTQTPPVRASEAACASPPIPVAASQAPPESSVQAKEIAAPTKSETKLSASTQQDIRAPEPKTVTEAVKVSDASDPVLKVEKKDVAPTVKLASSPTPAVEKPVEKIKPVEQVAPNPSPASRASRLAQATSKASGRRHVFLADLGSISIEHDSGVWVSDYSTTTDLIIVQNDRSISLCDKLETLVAEAVRKGTKTATNPIKGEILLSKWMDEFYRAEITSINDETKTANITFIDYGNTHVESLDKLQELPESVANSQFPALASVLKLDKVPTIPVTEPGIKEKLTQMKAVTEMALLKVTMVDASTTPKTVALKHANGKFLNKMLREKLEEKAKPGYKRAELKVLPDVAQKVIVLSNESPSKIFVCPENMVAAFQTMPGEINDHAETLKIDHFRPEEGSACLAKDTDDAWNRAVCLKEISGGKFSMYYADFGYTDEVGQERIRPISEDLMKIPFLAVCCALSGFDEANADEARVKRLKREVEEKLNIFDTVSVQVLASRGDVFEIKVPGINLS